MAVVLDASFLVDLRVRAPGAERRLRALVAEGEAMFVPTPVLTELLTGSSDPEEELGRLRSSAQIAEFGVDDAVQAARIARRMRKRGEFPGGVDAMVAGFAATRGDLPIVTANPRHFPESKTITY